MADVQMTDSAISENSPADTNRSNGSHAAPLEPSEDVHVTVDTAATATGMDIDGPAESPENLRTDPPAAVQHTPRAEETQSIIGSIPGLQEGSILLADPNSAISSELQNITDHKIHHGRVCVRAVLMCYADKHGFWVGERELCELAPKALKKYWDSFPGGRESVLGQHARKEVLRVLGHQQIEEKEGGKGPEMVVLVHWVGYTAEEATWEQASSMQEDVPDLMAAYWDTVNLEK